MGQRKKKVLQNTGLFLGSLLLFFLIAELIVFRFILPATDIPKNAFIDGVIRHQPDQRGYFRTADGDGIPYAINRQGWNSGREHYEREKRSNIKRIAIVGDSYVEALSVPYDQSLGEHLETQLNVAGEAAEVYRFGISGAPLSQYVHMLEQEVIDYAPDLVIVLLIHNDFDESFRFKAGRYTSSFLKLKMNGSDVSDEIEPAAYEAGLLDYLRLSATFRYLFYQMGLRPQMVRHLLFGREKVYEANIEVDQIHRQWPQIEAATDYLFHRLADMSAHHDIDLMLVMDANRQEIYAENAGGGSDGASGLNELSADLAARHRLPFLDLETAFATDWAKNGFRFEFPDDNHWNRHGHMKAAEAIADFINADCFPKCGSDFSISLDHRAGASTH